MTHDKDPDVSALEPFFVASRDTAPVPSDAFLTRMTADARRAQQQSPAPTAPVPRRRVFWPHWPALAGLATCLVVGIGLGGGFSAQVGAVADYYLAGGDIGAADIFGGSLDYIALLDEG